MNTYLLLIRNSATSAFAMATTGAEGAEHQVRHLEEFGLATVGHWLALGSIDQVLIVEGSPTAVLTFQLAAQMAGQEVELVTLVPPHVADEVAAVLERLPSPGDEPAAVGENDR